MFASVPSAVLFCAEGHLIHVEVQVSSGLPGFSLVGLPDTSIRESRDRARAAVLSSGLLWPKHKITVNLAPSGDRKAGSGLDLAIAVGVLAANGEIPPEAIEAMAFIGELGLDGSLRPVAGVAPMVGAVGERDVVVPVASAIEAQIVARGRVRPVAKLGELVDALLGEAPWPDHDPVQRAEPARRPPPDLADVQGQPVARHTLEVAAAGGHHTLFIGPPGAGKTMLASRLPGLLPPLDRDMALEVTMIHSASGIALPSGGLVQQAPFRAPHHTSSRIALVGGGSQFIRPGEVSIAHGGVLFMDELAEFSPSVLDGLRQPLESRVVHVSRAEVRAVLPANFLLVAAMNPCPCGGGAPGACMCGDAVLHRYARRVSGPLLDRFDLRVAVHRPAVDDLLVNEPGESSAVVAARVGRGADARRRTAAVSQQFAGNRSTRRGRTVGCRFDGPAPARTRARSTQRPGLSPHPPRGADDRRSSGPPRLEHRRGGRGGGAPVPGDPRAIDADREGGMTTGALPSAAFVAALAGFDRMTTKRLAGLLAQRTPEQAFAIAAGRCAAPEPFATLFAREPDLAMTWRRSGDRRHPDEVWGHCTDAGIEVVVAGDQAYPRSLLDDPRRPAALFVRGDLDVLDARRVGIVGTRNATQRGRETAARFGYELAVEGVVVVSGLAKGIDGAAHRGVLAVQGAPPVAVVGTGPDRPYPAQHAELWEAVAERGAVISEWPPGTGPDAFRFPLRNRILAALVEVLVVVESRERGGSLITAREAAERGVDVFAVPGAIQNRAAVGTNKLLCDGASPATETADVLMALGLDRRRAGRRRHDPRSLPRADDRRLIDACRVAPLTLEVLAQRCDGSLIDTAMAVARLEHAGWLRETAGWFEAIDDWADLA